MAAGTSPSATALATSASTAATVWGAADLQKAAARFLWNLAARGEGRYKGGMTRLSRKISLLLGTIALSASVFVVGCKKDEAPQAVPITSVATTPEAPPTAAQPAVTVPVTASATPPPPPPPPPAAPAAPASIDGC